MARTQLPAELVDASIVDPEMEEVLTGLEAQLGFKRSDNPEAFDKALTNLRQSGQSLSTAVVINDETGEAMTFSAYAEKLMHDASQAGVNVLDVVSLVKEITERLVPLAVAYPQFKGDENKLAAQEKALLAATKADKTDAQGNVTSSGKRLPETSPIYFDSDYSGVIAIQSPTTQEVVVVWRDFDVTIADANKTRNFKRSPYRILGVARNLDEDEARAMLNDAAAAKRAIWASESEGWGSADFGQAPDEAAF